MTDVLTVRSSDGLQTFLQRGKVPIVVGGTGFYLRWYVHGRPQTPASTQDSVARVQQLLKEARQLPMCARHVILDVAAQLAACQAKMAHRGTLLHRRSVCNLSQCTISTSISQPACKSMSMQYMLTACVQCVPARFSHTVKQAQDVAVQAWDKEAAAMDLEALTPEQQWEVGRRLVASLGDPASAERCRAFDTAGYISTSTDHVIAEGLSEGSSEDAEF